MRVYTNYGTPQIKTHEFPDRIRSNDKNMKYITHHTTKSAAQKNAKSMAARNPDFLFRVKEFDGINVIYGRER